MNFRLKQQIWRWTRGLGVLGFGVLGVSMLIRTVQPLVFQTAQIGHDTHRMQGQFGSENLASVPSSLAPVFAVSGEEKLEFAIANTPYTPNKSSTDDYHCFVIDAVRARDMTVTGIQIKPDNKRIVHHAILFKLEGDVKREALEKNRASGGQGWTCFGGPGVGGPTTVASAWLGAWVPGAGEGHFPDGVGVVLPKDALVVMQMHYNLNNVVGQDGAGQDRSSVSLDIAPEGKKQTELKAQLQFAPIEIPCAQGTNTLACDRDAVIQENTAKFGLIANQLPGRLLSLCGQKLERYQQPVGDASLVTSTCDRQAREDLTLHSVTGHMHLRGTSIKLEVNPNTNGAKTLLHIPKWDFHWQGSYWFENPVQVKRGDVLRITCTYDNSNASQPVIAGKPLEPRYVVWGEGTTDEMCLGVLMASSARN